MSSTAATYDTVDPKDFQAVFGSNDSERSPEDASIPRGERHSELVKLFKLPLGEPLVDDFICALRRRVLLQGRLYVFEHHACFHSRIFGHHKILTIPLKEVTQIRKKKMYGFPNSIEIVWRGKRESFGSFLKRDCAHRLLLYAWNKSTPYAKLFGEIPEGSEVSLSAAGDSKKVLGSARLGKLMYRRGEGSAHMKGDASQEDTISDEDDLSSGRAMPMDAGSVSEVQSHLTDSDDESESTGLEGLESWEPVPEKPQPAESSMTMLTESQFSISVRDFYKEFLSEQTQFLITWHESRGDTKVQLSEWHKHAVGHIRELTFITPLKQRIGPSKCLCTQTQRVRLHVGDHLVFETSQIMDIPYGDHFAVEARWDVTPLAEGKECKVEVRLGIPFSKRTIFRATIESSTRALMKEATENWIETAHRWLEPPIPVKSAFEDEGPGSSENEYQEPAYLTRAQSLHVRLSTDRVPDMDLLLRAPTAHRSDIARVLELQRRESERKLGSSLSFGASKRKSISFDLPGSPQIQSSKRKWLHVLSWAAFTLAISLSTWWIITTSWQGARIPGHFHSWLSLWRQSMEALPLWQRPSWQSFGRKNESGSNESSILGHLARIDDVLANLETSVAEMKRQLEAFDVRLQRFENASSSS